MTTGTASTALLEAHRVVGGARGRAFPAAVRPDHVGVGGHDAALVFALFESTGRERVACEPTLACGEGEISSAAEVREQVALERSARAHGAFFSRSGNGPLHPLYVAAFGAPGRLVLGADRRLAAAGALGMLALTTSPLELAGALAGMPVPRPEIRPMRVRLRGRPAAWLSGEDMVLELRRRLALAPPAGAVLEFEIDEPDAVPMEPRLAIARECPSLGALAGVFAADETTRRFLRACGRETDWKPIEIAPAPGPGALDLDFSFLEPLIEGPDGEVLPLKDRMGAKVDAVWLGPETDAALVARAALLLGREGIRSGVEVALSIPQRQIREAAALDGALAALRKAGARVTASASIRPPALRAGDGLALACGAGSARALFGGPRWQVAGPDACLASALAGIVADPRALAEPRAEPPWLSPVDRFLARPFPEGGPAERPSADGAIGAPIDRPMRGIVLIKLGDRFESGRILPWGARVQPLRLDFAALATFAFASVDSGFARRVAAHQGGWVVAGRDFGGGPRREQVGLVALRLGLRAMLAVSFDREFRRQLRQHGILSLRFAAADDYQDVESGDELEIPDLPEGLEAGKPLVVRNLTRGALYAVHHDLDEPAIEELKAGGLLAMARRRNGGRGAR